MFVDVFMKVSINSLAENEKFAAGEVEEADFEYRKAEIFHQMGLGEAPEPREEEPAQADA